MEKTVTALVVVKSAYQALQAMSVLGIEKVSIFDVLYLTEDDSPTDRHYFTLLSKKARRARYVHTYWKDSYWRRTLDFFVNSANAVHPEGYSIGLLGSIETWVVSGLVARNAKSIVTFDEGSGNFVEKSDVRITKIPFRSNLYRILLGAPSLKKIKKATLRHYTYHPKFQNIVEPRRLRPMELPYVRTGNYAQTEKAYTYFIGQPFLDYLTDSQVESVRKWLEDKTVDYYVQHPREKSGPIINVPLLDKGSLVAEQAILNHADGAKIHLIGCSTTVLVGLEKFAASRTMLIHSSQVDADAHRKFAMESGCEVVLLFD